MEKKIQKHYLNLVRLVSSGNIDKARAIVETLALTRDELRNLEDAMLRDTGRTIT